jgi:uncharacterized membrane protein YphA (DoxX/SURF4 family)
MSTIESRQANNVRRLNIALWIAQIVVASLFITSGLLKLLTPIHQLAQMMRWTGQTPLLFVRSIALIDLAGGIGIILPALTRVLPGLTVLAALGCTIVQVLAIVFHGSRGEFSVLPINAILLPLSAFVLWGRRTRVPIPPRKL